MNIKLFVNNKDAWEAFLEHAANEIKQYQGQLQRASEPVDIYRLQGKIDALNKLTKLRDQVNGRETK